jgi:hypothetical protein
MTPEAAMLAWLPVRAETSHADGLTFHTPNARQQVSLKEGGAAKVVVCRSDRMLV